MKISIKSSLILSILSIPLVLGCQNDATDELDIEDRDPHGIVAMARDHAQEELYCGSEHAAYGLTTYYFEAKQGYKFDFVATPTDMFGNPNDDARILLYVLDNDTDWYDYQWGFGSVKLRATPEVNTSYSVYVWRFRGGRHSVKVDCTLLETPHCATWETVDGNGNPYQVHHSHNVKSFEEGKKLLSGIANSINEEIRKGTCLKVAQSTMCPAAWAPVCGSSATTLKTFGNFCEFKNFIVEKGGETGFAKGRWELGQCEPHCVTWSGKDPETGEAHQNFYAKNVMTYDGGKRVLKSFGYFTNEQIEKGTCFSIGDQTPCFKHCPRICTDFPKLNTAYCNTCELRVGILKFAGDKGEAKGSWEDGPCLQFCGGIAGLPCPKGTKCKLDGNYPDAGGYCHPLVCEYNGQGYLEGETFPSTDGCNKCSCMENGNVACTEMYCVPKCDPAHEIWRDYMSTDTDECAVMKFVCPAGAMPFFNDCGCGCEPEKCNPYNEPNADYKSHDLGQCKAMLFTCPEGQAQFVNDCGCGCEQLTTCEYDGQIYNEGDSFPAADGCNKCSCRENGNVACTKMLCEPVCTGDEYWREYKGDPKKCQLIKFYCPENTNYFSDKCGCGCEQSKDCPQWFNCMPPAPCDVQEIKTRCPFSQIAW